MIGVAIAAPFAIVYHRSSLPWAIGTLVVTALVMFAIDAVVQRRQL